ncbi:MAG: hypothetical protein IKQ61_04185 [Spirochaetales bacterium]|nr:hypothetical protein [Spirochaetales bacterium]
MKYGFPKLGELANFIRDCIGDDALLEQKSQEIQNYDREKDKERIKKEWNRFCQEKKDNYETYNLNDNEIFRLCRKFFEEMKKLYNFPTLISEGLFQFVENFYNEMKKENQRRLIPEGEINKFALLSIHQTVTLILIPKYEKNYDLQTIQNNISHFLSKDYCYKTLFDQLLQKTNLPSLKKYIDRLEQTFDETEQNKKNPVSFRDTIEDAINSNKNPTWHRFKFILQYCPTELKTDFLFHYIFNNLQAALQKYFDISENDFKKIFSSLKNNVTQPIEDIQSLHSAFPLGIELDILQSFYNKTFKEYEYKKVGKDAFLRSLNELKNILPNASSFFIPWFKGFVYAADEKFDETRSCFKQAFDHYQFAGDFLSQFVEMAFSFENYFSKWDKTRKSINQEDNNINPVTKEAKMYWNFGYAIGLFDKKADDLHREVFQQTENFIRYFPSESFFDEGKAKERLGREIMEERHIFNTPIDSIKERPKLIYEILSSLKTQIQRNKLISYSKLYESNQNDNHLYTPLSLCIIHGITDNRLWDLADEWIKDTLNPIDVDKICFNGSTALHEALTIYSRMRRNSTEETDQQRKIRDLASKLIDKTTYIGETKLYLHIHPLQLAIDAYDLDFVKRIADKIPDEEFQTLKISADELSPLYYILNRRSPLMRGISKYIETAKLNPDNVVWKNSIFPGYTENDKRKYREWLQNSNDSFPQFFQNMQDIDNQLYELMYGFTTKDKQLETHKEIINYLISRTENVDDFIKMIPYTNGVGCNALLYAAENNDTYACRKLIQAGADVTKVIGECLLPIGYNVANTPNSFIFRLIYWQSWDALKMFLTEFPDKAKLIMGKGKYDISPMEYFIIWTEILRKKAPSINESMELMSIQKEITPLFMKAEAVL